MQNVIFLKVFQIAGYLSSNHIWQRPFHKTEEIEILSHDKLKETEKQLGTNTATTLLSKVPRILNAIFSSLLQHSKCALKDEEAGH